MNWKQVKLNECCLSIADGDHQPPPKAESGVAFITISNINSFNGLDFSNTMYVPQAYYEKLDDKRKPSKGDILLTVVGSFGIPVYIENDSRFVFQRHIALLRPNKQVILPCFLYNYMRNKAFMAQADAYAVGVAQRTISLNSLRKFKILLPDIGTQKRIASILSAYDALIENNIKRIKILEQMAENLYKEWFVRFRFPGYENAEFENGIPKGWKIKRLSDGIAQVTAGGDRPDIFSPDKTDACSVPIFSNGIDNYGFYGYTNHPRISQESVTISARGTVGFVCLREEPYVPIVRLLSIIPCNDVISAKFLYFALKTSYLEGNGTSQQQLTVPMIGKKKLLLPENKLIKRFTNIISPMYAHRRNLITSNKNLIKQRDMLLPRLMSGKLEV